MSETIFITPEFRKRDRELAIGLGGAFPEESFQAISRLWDTFLSIKNRIPLQNRRGDYSLGICCLDHDQIKKSSQDCLVYIAALPVHSIEPECIPEGMVGIEIPAKEYAVFRHIGRLDKLPMTIDYIWGNWVPKNRQLCSSSTDSPDFELYDQRFDPQSEESEFDIYVPLEHPLQ